MLVRLVVVLSLGILGFPSEAAKAVLDQVSMINVKPKDKALIDDYLDVLKRQREGDSQALEQDELLFLLHKINQHHDMNLGIYKQHEGIVIFSRSRQRNIPNKPW